MPEASAHVPVLVGGGQITDRPEDPTAGLDPLALMEAATRRALEDARAGAALGYGGHASPSEHGGTSRCCDTRRRASSK